MVRHWCQAQWRRRDTERIKIKEKQTLGMIWPPGYCHFSKEQSVCVHEEAAAAEDGVGAQGNPLAAWSFHSCKLGFSCGKTSGSPSKHQRAGGHCISCFYQDTLELSWSRGAEAVRSEPWGRGHMEYILLLPPKMWCCCHMWTWRSTCHCNGTFPL